MFICKLCGSKIGDVVAKKDEIRFECYGYNKDIIKCSKCGMVQLYPMWTESELDKLYQGYSLKKDFKGCKHKKKIDYYLKKYLRGYDILEIGAGGGENVSYFQKKGYNVIGIDKDPSVCDGKNILNYDIESMPVFKKFDFIYGMHVLEHIANPIEFLKKVRSLLKDDGGFLFEIPNVDDPILTLYKNRNYQKFYWYPFHVFFYNKLTLNKLFQKMNGFTFDIMYKQRYGLLNHMRWALLGKPGNINFNIPMLDSLYKSTLNKILKKSDTLIVIGEKI
jgi:SAM-dependent methyltransferase